MSKLYLLTSPSGVEDVVAADALRLGASKAEPKVGRVVVEADASFLHRANLAHPTAGKVHLVLAEGEVQSLDDVRRLVQSVPWEDVLDIKLSFAVRGLRVGTHDFTSIEAERAGGDGVCARFRAATKERPPVDLNAPDVEVAVEIHDAECVVGVNTTGESLHRRPWRAFQAKAPLAANLASALVALSGWSGAPGSGALLDPLCGSGTIPIEADHRARGVAPNLHREAWPFERLKGHDPSAFLAAKDALAHAAAAGSAPVFGNDRNPAMVEGAARNAARAGARVALTAEDFNRLPRPEGVTHVVANPPWGLRITSRKVSDRIAGELRARLDAWALEGPLTAVVFVGNRRFEKLGEPPAEARDVQFGGVACRALTYRLG